MESKLLARKKALEEEILRLNEQREGVTAKMLNPAKQAISEINQKHFKADVAYKEVCELLGLDVSQEWAKAEKEQKPIPREEAEEPKD